MSDYSAPVRDMQFVLDEIVDMDALTALDAFAAIDTEMLPGILEEAGRFFAEVVAPINRTGDVEHSVRNADGSITTPTGFIDAYRQYVDAGWGAVGFDPEFGGGGFPWVFATALQEMMTAANMAFSLCPMLTQGSIHLLTDHGTTEQQLRWLPKLITGEWTGTINLTEPQAGSDVGALSAKAVRQEDGTYRITGQKIYITWGEHDLTENIVHLVLARTPDAAPGTKGISCFVVPKYLVNDDGSLGEANDISCVSIEHKMGINASPTCVLSFGDSGEGAVGEIIGDEGSGMRYMFTMMNYARLAVGLEGLAVADRGHQQALEHALERTQGRRPDTPKGESAAIIEHPDVRRMLLTMKAFIEAMRCLVYLNAEAIDIATHHPDDAQRQAGREMADLLTPLSKAWCTDLGTELTSIAVQVHGGMGYIEETGAAQHFRDSKIAAIYEGTNGIQAIDLVGRKLPMRDGAVVAELLDRVAALESELTGDLAALWPPLDEAVAATREASEWLLANGGDAALAGATPYLRLLSTVTGGWLMARSAIAARARLDEGATGEDAEFYEAKTVTARFFCEQIVPQATGLVPAITAGADPLYALSATQLR
ncbi:MAG: acyl-CoA dehydrogenase [Acidimicrobiales bacterium]